MERAAGDTHGVGGQYYQRLLGCFWNRDRRQSGDSFLMAKTLLQLTQNILSAMDSDEVNSISDTVEAVQVATIVMETLEAEFNNIDLPDFNSIQKIESVSDPL